MKRTIALSLTLLLSSYAISANALTATLSSGPLSPELSATTIDFGSFDLGTSPSYDLPSTPAYTYGGGALFNVDVGISGTTARPVGSTGNFWSVGLTEEQVGPGTVTFSAPITYFGFLWGSPDDSPWNSVSFYDSNEELLGVSYNGTNTGLTNDWGNTTYFNVYAGQGEFISKVVFTASQNAFETDNHAFITATPVPEPETYGMMLAGLGLIGFMARRRMNG